MKLARHYFSILSSKLRLKYVQSLFKACLSLLAIVVVILNYPRNVFAHGTIISPQSRIHKCRFDGNVENHADPACRAAIEFGGKQAIYDWNSLRQGSANSQHQSIIPNGQLCSGGNAIYRGMDVLRKDWRRTEITPDSRGMFEFVYHGTAPHGTKDWIFYVTKEGWKPGTALTWSNIEEFCRLGEVPLVQGNQGRNVYRLNCPLPARSGDHVIYNIWQRSDSPEAFYSCSDVTFEGATAKPVCISCVLDLLVE